MLCHKHIKKMSKELAGAAYENFAKNDEFYKAFPNQNAFIARHWKNFIGIARQTLVFIMDKSSNYPEAMKAEAFEIYMQDRMLQDVRSVPASQAANLPMMQPMGNA